MYLYRAVDKGGKTIDFYLSRRRDVNAAKAFLRKAMKGQRTPTKITLDAYAASHRAVADLKENGELGVKSFRTAAVVIGGIELAEKIKKRQFKIGLLGGSKATMPELWQAALAA
jgi:transposase-like protein